MTDDDPGPTRADRAERFGRVTSEAARSAGYDIDSPRGGGKRDLAAAAGMSEPSVSRMLAGKTIPDPKVFESLANALGIKLATLLVESGLASKKALGGAVPKAPLRPKLTIRRAAKELGIHSERGLKMFTAMTQSIIEQEPPRDSGEDRGVA
ncbi:helix-turn-helix domain-containing protein [Streptomyces sp. NPDC088197]|uniref:helix-turn-helix domain-containing protein n=1 Tax=Streptomyces sp. NPDC088197 TaxID=3365840 RepID=UPI0038233491